MRKMMVNGKEIRTNYKEHNEYPMHNGYGGTTMYYEKLQWVKRDGEQYKSQECIDEMFNRLVEKGYSRITFYRMSTSIRGYNEVVAFCKYQKGI